VPDTRRRGLCFLSKRLGTIPEGHIAVSRLYPSEKSWTRSPVWWFDLPVAKLRSGRCKTVYLLGEKRGGKGFWVLRVPSSRILSSVRNLCLCRLGEVVRLHLSARPGDRFVDLRGVGHVSFRRYAAARSPRRPRST